MTDLLVEWAVVWEAWAAWAFKLLLDDVDESLVLMFSIIKSRKIVYKTMLPKVLFRLSTIFHRI